MKSISIEAVVHPASLLPGVNKSSFFESLEVKREFGLGNIEAIAHVANAKLSLLQKFDDLDTNRLG